MPIVAGDEFTTSSLVFCDDALRLVLGGNGANCAYTLAGLGAAVALFSAVGVDELGRLVTERLRDRGVDLQGLVRSEQRATAYTTIISDRAQNRLAFHHPGALAGYSVADIPSDLLAKADVVLAASYPILPQLRPAGFTQILGAAHRRGALTALDIGPAVGEPARLAELTPLLSTVDYFLANQHELAVCTAEQDIAAGAECVLAAGAGCVIVKCGAAGAIAFRPRERLDVPAFAVAVHSTVGAGDSFNAGLLLALQRGEPLAAAIRFGNATAALVIASPAGILGAPTGAQVAALLTSGEPNSGVPATDPNPAQADR